MPGRDALYAIVFARGVTLAHLLGAKKKTLRAHDVHKQRTHETPPSYFDPSLAARIEGEKHRRRREAPLRRLSIQI